MVKSTVRTRSARTGRPRTTTSRQTQSRLDSIFHALSDSTRRSILRDVAAQERTVSQIASPYQMSLAAVSKHLKVLESSQLISREKRGSFQIVRLNPGPMQEAEQWLSYYEKFWNQRLDALQHFLEGDSHVHDVPDAHPASQPEPKAGARIVAMRK
jgi:DNA-binding transcriptional ArsR family regulator